MGFCESENAKLAPLSRQGGSVQNHRYLFSILPLPGEGPWAQPHQALSSPDPLPHNASKLARKLIIGLGGDLGRRLRKGRVSRYPDFTRRSLLHQTQDRLIAAQ